ncbi:MAG: hypothetical protein H0U36_06615, partial [Nocardioidaceae bacterium]|nr:hypothetical protein [Nocardioidaceae bacterium]
ADEVERFTIYEPVNGQEGEDGVLAAMRAFGSSLGPELGYVETFIAASMLKQRGQAAAAKSLIEQMYARASPEQAQRIREMVELQRLDPFA